jgi:hypothetical protein
VPGSFSLYSRTCLQSTSPLASNNARYYFSKMDRFSSGRLYVEVRHRLPKPKKYTWQIHVRGKATPLEESKDSFSSWEAANQAGKDFLHKMTANQS